MSPFEASECAGRGPVKWRARVIMPRRLAKCTIAKGRSFQDE